MLTKFPTPIPKCNIRNQSPGETRFLPPNLDDLYHNFPSTLLEKEQSSMNALANGQRTGQRLAD
jgi:hypothetical protein